MIVTFYSFKGGVGRSMAMVNVGEILADAGYDVVVCDFDLEAPGIERYLFQTSLESDRCQSWRGVIDLLEEYKQSLTGSAAESLPAPSLLAKRVDEKRRRSGSLRLLTAGQRNGEGDPPYARKVQAFSWTDFYSRWAGGAYLEFFRKDLAEHRDIVLLDSRTGVTEHGGVCTHHLADLDILMTAANDLNLAGTLWMAQNLSRDSLLPLRDGRKLDVLPVATRIEQSSQKNELSAFRAGFLASFSKHVPPCLGDAQAVLAASEIPYIPYYAFTERVVAREAKEERHRELYAAYTALAHAIVLVGVANHKLRLPPHENWLRPSFQSELGMTGSTSLKTMILAHREWVISNGQRGEAAPLARMDLKSQDFSDAVLERVDLSESNLERATLSRANLRRANLMRAILVSADLQESLIDGANLEEATLERANLKGARGQESRLVRAQLRSADLTNSDFANAEMTGASLERTDLRGANLSGVIGLTRSQLQTAIINGNTKLPFDIAADHAESSPTVAKTYNAFMTYSHAAGGRLGPKLCKAVERFGTAWYRFRTIRIFRDEASLMEWSKITQILQHSEYFLLLASPESAQTPLIKLALDTWAKERQLDNLILIVTGGEVRWEPETGDFNWKETTALPETLRGRFPAQPFWLDLRWISSAEDLSLDTPQFRNAVANIAAILHRTPKDNLLRQDVRQRLISHRLLASFIATVILLLTATSFVALYGREKAKIELQKALQENDKMRQMLLVQPGQK